jgi:hypothetical protein
VALLALSPNTVYEVCGSRVRTGLCNMPLLKGGIALGQVEDER